MGVATGCGCKEVQLASKKSFPVRSVQRMRPFKKTGGERAMNGTARSVQIPV